MGYAPVYTRQGISTRDNIGLVAVIDGGKHYTKNQRRKNCLMHYSKLEVDTFGTSKYTASYGST